MLLVSSKVCNYYEVCIDTLANDNSIISSPPPTVSHIFHQIGDTLAKNAHFFIFFGEDKEKFANGSRHSTLNRRKSTRASF